MRALKNLACVSLLSVTLGALCSPRADAQQNPQNGQQNQSSQPSEPSQPQQPEQPEGQSSAPIPAFHSPLAGAAGNLEDENGNQEITPDTRSLSGAENLSLGLPTERNYWQPHVDIFVTADSNPNETSGGSDWGMWTSLTGGIDLHRQDGNNNLILSYTSGGLFTNQSGTGNGVIQGLSVVDKIAFRRSAITFLDELEYLPESSLGYGGLGGITIPGGTSSGLGTGFTPGQSILTGQGQNLGNSFATELDTFLTARSSLTFVGGYSLLHYFDDNLFDYDNFNFRAGYNYQLSRSDTIAFSYTFTGIRYGNSNQSVDAHTFQASYAKRLTGRLAFQVAAGPQLVSSRLSFTGIDGSGGEPSVPMNVTELLWSLSTALQWQSGRTGLGLTYNHGVSGGSGVLLGAETDIVTGSVSRQISRTFSDGINVGYSRNDGLGIGETTPFNQTYDYWFAGGTLSHPIGRTLALNFSYQLQYQSTNAAVCVGSTCGTSIVRNLISVGVGWHPLPMNF